MRSPSPTSRNSCDRARFEHAGANALQHMGLRLPLEHDAVDSVALQHMRKQQAGRSAADDRDLSAGDLGAHDGVLIHSVVALGKCFLLRAAMSWSDYAAHGWAAPFFCKSFPKTSKRPLTADRTYAVLRTALCAVCQLFIPAARATAVQRAISVRMRAANSSGPISSGS